MYRDYDTVNVVVSGSGTFELWINPLAVTNLRTNIEDRNLWDKALLIKAIGQRQWLPLTVVRDVDQHAGLFGILPELGGEDESEEEEDYRWLSQAQREEYADRLVEFDQEYLDPFDQAYVDVMEEHSKYREANKMRLEAYNYRRERRRIRKKAELLSEYLEQAMYERDPDGSIAGAKWIYKPADGNKASGIKIFEDVAKLAEFCHELGLDPQVGVIQQYLEYPWLVEHATVANDTAFRREKMPFLRSKKFDMRMFLLVTYEPPPEDRGRRTGGDGVPWLKAYLHKDGICRFSTADYDVEDLSEENRRAHLTNNAINKDAPDYNPSNNLVSLQDLERLMPKGWTLEEDFYPYVEEQVCTALAAHVAGGELPRRGFQLFGIDLMLVQPEDPRDQPHIYLLEVNLRPKLDIPDEVSVKFQRDVKAIVDDVIMCIEEHHDTGAKDSKGAKGSVECERENRFNRVHLPLNLVS